MGRFLKSCHNPPRSRNPVHGVGIRFQEVAGNLNVIADSAGEIGNERFGVIRVALASDERGINFVSVSNAMNVHTSP